jgi:hypothetical protein
MTQLTAVVAGFALKVAAAAERLLSVLAGSGSFLPKAGSRHKLSAILFRRRGGALCN